MRNYRGRKSRGGLSAGQVGLVALMVLIAMLGMTIHISAAQTGISAGEQIYTALFVARDWE